MGLGLILMICHSGLRFQALPVQVPAKAKEGALGTEDQAVVVGALEVQADPEAVVAVPEGLVVVVVRVDQVPVVAVEAEAIKKNPVNL